MGEIIDTPQASMQKEEENRGKYESLTIESSNSCGKVEDGGERAGLIGTHGFFNEGNPTKKLCLQTPRCGNSKPNRRRRRSATQTPKIKTQRNDNTAKLHQFSDDFLSSQHTIADRSVRRRCNHLWEEVDETLTHLVANSR